MRDRLYFEDLNGDPYIMLLKVYMIGGLTDIPLLKKKTGSSEIFTLLGNLTFFPGLGFKIPLTQ